MPKKDDSMEVDGEDKETEEERQIRDEKIKVNKKYSILVVKRCYLSLFLNSVQILHIEYF